MRRSATFFALVLTGVTAACAHAPSSPAASAPATPTPIAVQIESQSIGNAHPTVTETVKGRIIYQLRALSEHADNSGADNARFEQPHIVFHAKDGAILIADAPQASVTRRDKRVLMTGGVHARRQDGTTLTCDTLRYDGQSERIHAEGNVVVVTHQNERLAGDRLDSDVKLEHVHMTRGNVR